MKRRQERRTDGHETFVGETDLKDMQCSVPLDTERETKSPRARPTLYSRLVTFVCTRFGDRQSHLTDSLEGIRSHRLRSARRMSSSAPPPSPPQGQGTSFSCRNTSWLVVALLAIAVAAFVRDADLLFLKLGSPFETSSAAVDCVDARRYLTDVMPVKGFHVLCVETKTRDTCVARRCRH